MYFILWFTSVDSFKTHFNEPNVCFIFSQVPWVLLEQGKSCTSHQGHTQSSTLTLAPAGNLFRLPQSASLALSCMKKPEHSGEHKQTSAGSPKAPMLNYNWRIRCSACRRGSSVVSSSGSSSPSSLSSDLRWTSWDRPEKDTSGVICCRSLTRTQLSSLIGSLGDTEDSRICSGGENCILLRTSLKSPDAVHFFQYLNKFCGDDDDDEDYYYFVNFIICTSQKLFP